MACFWSTMSSSCLFEFGVVAPLASKLAGLQARCMSVLSEIHGRSSGLRRHLAAKEMLGQSPVACSCISLTTGPAMSS